MMLYTKGSQSSASRVAKFNDTYKKSHRDYKTNVQYSQANIERYETDPASSAELSCYDVNGRFLSRLNTNVLKPQKQTKIVVQNTDSFALAQTVAQSPDATPLVLNMANKLSIGGGVVHGSVAQEEDLCRCSTLYAALEVLGEEVTHGKHKGRLHYKHTIPEFGSYYVKDVAVFKSSDGDATATLRQPFETDVICIAGYDLGKPQYLESSLKPYVGDDTALLREFKSKTKIKIRHLFDVARLNDRRDLILGALSCGAFSLRSAPEATTWAVAEAFQEVIYDEGYDQHFDSINFAVLSRGKNPNYDIFKRAIINREKSPQNQFSDSQTMIQLGLFICSSALAISGAAYASMPLVMFGVIGYLIEIGLYLYSNDFAQTSSRVLSF